MVDLPGLFNSIVRRNRTSPSVYPMHALSCRFSRPSEGNDGGEEIVAECLQGEKSQGSLTKRIRRKTASWTSVRRLKQVRSILSPKNHSICTKSDVTPSSLSSTAVATKTIRENHARHSTNGEKTSQETPPLKAREKKTRRKSEASVSKVEDIPLSGKATPVNNNAGSSYDPNRTPPTTATTVWSRSNITTADDHDDDTEALLKNAAGIRDNYPDQPPAPTREKSIAGNANEPIASCTEHVEHVSLSQDSVRHLNSTGPSNQLSPNLRSSSLLSSGRKRPVSPVLKQRSSRMGSFAASNRSSSVEVFQTPQPIKMGDFASIPEESKTPQAQKNSDSAPTTASPSTSPTRATPSVSPVAVSTQPVRAASTKSPGNDEADLLAAKLESMRADYANLIKLVNHPDCKVPNAILDKLQNETLEVFQQYGLTPRFLIQSRLAAGQKEASTSCSISTAADISKMVKRLPRVDNVLAESYMKFFTQGSDSSPRQAAQNLTPVQKIDGFISEIHSGPLSGRVPVGNVLKNIHDFPVVMYGIGKFDEALHGGIKTGTEGPARWRTVCNSFCPITVTVLLEPSKDAKSEKALGNAKVCLSLEQIGVLVADLLSDWRCHRLRIFTNLAEKHQLLVPSISSISQQDMKKAGWSEMKFGDENVIRWKCIRDGVLLSYIAGCVDASLDKALALVYDGDNHKNWIPFLTATERLFGMAPLLFSFGYGVALPWPLNRRELTILGMATDSLRMPGINSIQMWGTHIPAAATTVFGLPVKKPTPGCVSLELPVLSFFLSPVTKNKTQVRMLGAVDVKMNIVPMALQTYMAKHLATKMFKNVQKLCRDFDTTEYPTVIEENRQLFDELLEGVDTAVEEIKRNGAV